MNKTNGETEVDINDLSLEEKVDVLLEAVTEMNEKFEEVIEKLSNLSLGGVDYDIFEES